eukprot:scaffold1074_cov409-Prasinococcus_capsulatus_cf.AAC.4
MPRSNQTVVGTKTGGDGRKGKHISSFPFTAKQPYMHRHEIATESGVISKAATGESAAMSSANAPLGAKKFPLSITTGSPVSHIPSL